MSEREFLIAKASRELSDKQKKKRGEDYVVRRGGEYMARVKGGAPGIAAQAAGFGAAAHGALVRPAGAKLRGAQVAAGAGLYSAGMAGQIVGQHRAGNKWRKKQGLPQRDLKMFSAPVRDS